jgi:hypothetical protein
LLVPFSIRRLANLVLICRLASPIFDLVLICYRCSPIFNLVSDVSFLSVIHVLMVRRLDSPMYYVLFPISYVLFPICTFYFRFVPFVLVVR